MELTHARDAFSYNLHHCKSHAPGDVRLMKWSEVAPCFTIRHLTNPQNFAVAFSIFSVFLSRHLIVQVTVAKWRQPLLQDGPRWQGPPYRHSAVPQPSREMSLKGEGPPDGHLVACTETGMGGARERWRATGGVGRSKRLQHITLAIQ